MPEKDVSSMAVESGDGEILGASDLIVTDSKLMPKANVEVLSCLDSDLG